MRGLIVGLVGFVAYGLVGAGAAFADNIVFSDDFSSGTIDSSKWVVGGRRVAWSPSDEGSWTWSHDASGGYLRMTSQGPLSGNSYGATRGYAQRTI